MGKDWCRYGFYGCFDCGGAFLCGVFDLEMCIRDRYEYYMMSVDTEKEVEIPRIVLMYFAYQSNLDYDKCAYLYAYIQKHREEFPELYLAYKSQMDRFVLQQLYKGRINRQPVSYTHLECMGIFLRIIHQQGKRQI